MEDFWISNVSGTELDLLQRIEKVSSFSVLGNMSHAHGCWSISSLPFIKVHVACFADGYTALLTSHV